MLLLFTAVSCSVEKNTGATRAYHNLTSHYNIYFNGNESYKKGLLKAEDMKQDDYTRILPLFYYHDQNIVQSISPQMQRAIDKASKVVTFHSITAKPELKKGGQSPKDKEFYDKNEYNKWVDDSYMLMGMAYMYKGEFFLAGETFKHVINTFPKEPVKYQAMAWLARSYVMIGELREADRLTGILLADENFPDDFRLELNTTVAELKIAEKKYSEAATALAGALPYVKQKSEKQRYSYILAQLYQECDMKAEATKAFGDVLKLNPPYEMAFNAKVNMAGTFDASSGNSAEIRALLQKMLKDSKNKEYLDQIYYALGNISASEGKEEEAVELYHKSVASSLQNNYQKGLSCITLARIYYSRPDYTLSAAYYDTAMNLLDPAFPDYAQLMVRSKSLTSLVRNMNTYILQDSVQRLAAMPEPERLAVIDRIIEDVRKEEAEAARKQQEAMEALRYNQSAFQDGSMGSFSSTQQEGGKWYFYNLNAKSFGQPEFRMKWGDRKLEDNWRRKNRQNISVLLESDGEGKAANGGDKSGQLIDNKTREYYLKNIPLSDSALAVSDKLLEEALFRMGTIYKDQLFDYQKSIDAFEKLVNRYPDGDYTMTGYYQLYELFNTVQNPTQAAFYRDLLIRKYPESHLAKLLTNPNYIKELEAEENRIVLLYEQVYEAYKQERYPEVIRRSDEALKAYPGDALLPKFTYLRAMSLGAVEGKEVMKSALDSLIARYPNSEVAPLARDVVAYMYEAFPVIKEKEQEQQAREIYMYNPAELHFFMIALNRKEDLNQVSFNLLNFNLDNFNKYDLEIEKTSLNNQYNLIVVKAFNNFQGASRYAGQVRESLTEIMGEIPATEYFLLPVSGTNYNKLIQSKDLKPYLIFFESNYNW
ncbi:MAG: tetratricopeptide repeat protein [Bacteroidota bacterium]